MTVPNMAFNPPNGLRDVSTYPTVPASEADARDQVQDQSDQIRDYINASVVPVVNQNTLDIAGLKGSTGYNAIINGNFSVNQRVVSGTVTLTAGKYGHDRWKAGSGGCTYTFTTTENVTTINITAGSLVQVIEGINLISGTYTLSWTGTAQGKIGAGSYGTSGITGNATGGTNLSIEFNAGTLSNVVFNPGDQALPFQPHSFAEELTLCMRYYEKSYLYQYVPGIATPGASIQSVTEDGTAAGAAYSYVSFIINKRTPPTINIYGTGGTINTVNDEAGDRALGAGSFVVGASEKGFQQNYTLTGATSRRRRFHFVADAEL